MHIGRKGSSSRHVTAFFFFPLLQGPFWRSVLSCDFQEISDLHSVSATIKKKEKLAAISAHPGHRPRPRQSIMWNSVGDFCNCCCMGIIRQHLHSRLCLIRPPEKSTVAFLLEPLYYCSCFEWAVFCFYVVDSLPVKTEARGSSDLPYPVKWMILSPVCQLLGAVLTENSTQGQAIVIMYLFQNNFCIRIKINNQQRLFQLLPH